MNHFPVLIFQLCLAASVLISPACRRDAGNAHEQPSLIREQAQPAATVSEPGPLPTTGPGNFESLVADYESKDRAIWQKPGMVISLLGDLEGKTVADIGAGTGYFAFRILPKAEKVIGIDIDPRFIQFMDSVKVRLPEPYRHRFESRLAGPDNPGLKAEEVDAVIIVNTYGYIENRPLYLQRLLNGLAPGGQVLIIDFKKNSLPIGPPENYKVSHSQVERELREAGFVVQKIDKTALDYQYIILADKPAQAPK